jgi:hypothetical protein
MHISTTLRSHIFFAFEQSHIAYKDILFVAFKLMFLPPWSNGIDVFAYTKFVQNPNNFFCHKLNTSLHITPLHPKIL